MTDQPKNQVILIAEDDTALLQAMVDKFTRTGFTVLTAHDGAEGLTLALEKHPDVILMDILMPKMDGVTMMDTLRRDEWGKTVPIIILTNLDTTSTMISTIQKDQPAYYLLKSNTSVEDLVEKVKEVIRK